MPPLRERRSDVPAARAVLPRALRRRTTARRSTGSRRRRSRLLAAYDWPGNVRELENAIERAVVLDGHAGGAPADRAAPAAGERAAAARAGGHAARSRARRWTDLERYAILETLKSTGGSTSKAAEILGISVRTIQYRLHQYNAAPRSEVEVVRPRGPAGRARGADRREAVERRTSPSCPRTSASATRTARACARCTRCWRRASRSSRTGSTRRCGRRQARRRCWRTRGGPRAGGAAAAAR